MDRVDLSENVRVADARRERPARRGRAPRRRGPRGGAPTPAPPRWRSAAGGRDPARPRAPRRRRRARRPRSTPPDGGGTAPRRGPPNRGTRPAPARARRAPRRDRRRAGGGRRRPAPARAAPVRRGGALAERDRLVDAALRGPQLGDVLVDDPVARVRSLGALVVLLRLGEPAVTQVQEAPLHLDPRIASGAPWR